MNLYTAKILFFVVLGSNMYVMPSFGVICFAP